MGTLTPVSRFPSTDDSALGTVTVVRKETYLHRAALAPPTHANLEDARAGMRQVWSDGAWCETAIYDRLALPAGAIVPGPAILEQPDGTIFVDSGLVGEVDSFGNIIMGRSNDKNR